MPRFRLTISYDGTAYSGWQVQPRHPTIQATLEGTLAAIVGHACKVHGSGRTDRGVHALGQVAHVDLETRMDGAALQRALNSRLPADIRILAGRRTRPDFHARRDALSKEYRYHIWNAPVLPPLNRHQLCHVRRPLDPAAMRSAAALLVGRHDFAAFMANPNRIVEDTTRTISAFTITRRGAAILCRVRGDGFLYRQVRGMVGLLIRIGSGAESPRCIEPLLQTQRIRTARVPSAPPQGLCLWRVWYR